MSNPMAVSADLIPPNKGKRVSAFAGAPVRRELADLLRLAWPVVLSRVGMMAMGFTDLIVVSHYSTRELGYQAMGWAPTAVIMVTAIGLVSGVQVISSRRIGEGRPRATGEAFQLGLLSATILGLIASLILVTGGPWFLGQLHMEPDLVRGASGVLKVLAWSMPFQIVLTATSSYLEALKRPKPATLAMWVCNGVNLGLNLLLVPGALGIPAMGAEGAAWATFGSRGVLAAWLIIYVLSMKDAREWGVFDRFRPNAYAVRELFKPGLGAAASYFVEVAAFNAMNVYAGWLGAATVAAWAVVLNAMALVFMLPMGLAAATSVLVARAYGANDRHGVVRAGMLGFGVTVAGLGLVSVIMALFPRTIAGIYSSDPTLLNLAGPALVLAAAGLFFVLDGLQVVAAQSLRARADVLVPTLTHTLSYLILMVPLGWLLAIKLDMGLTGILWAVIAATVAAAGLLLARFWQLTRRY
jgi:multidrug resistance protein, MATE family